MAWMTCSGDWAAKTPYSTSSVGVATRARNLLRRPNHAGRRSQRPGACPGIPYLPSNTRHHRVTLSDCSALAHRRTTAGNPLYPSRNSLNKPLLADVERPNAMTYVATRQISSVAGILIRISPDRPGCHACCLCVRRVLAISDDISSRRMATYSCSFFLPCGRRRRQLQAQQR
jgi:hypothetical protein